MTFHHLRGKGNRLVFNLRKKKTLPQKQLLHQTKEVTNRHHCLQSLQHFSSYTGKGYDLLGDPGIVPAGEKPKITLESVSPSGFDVNNMMKKVDENESAESGFLHMNGSIIAFPTSCFLWKVEDPKDITADSLAPILLHRPKLNYLFIGTAQSMDFRRLQELKREIKEQYKDPIVVEWLPLSEAMATFNILNAEDRMVAAALLIDRDESNYKI